MIGPNEYNPPLRPVHVATSDWEPTDAEIEAIWKEVNPGPRPFYDQDKAAVRRWVAAIQKVRSTRR